MCGRRRLENEEAAAKDADLKSLLFTATIYYFTVIYFLILFVSASTKENIFNNNYLFILYQQKYEAHLILDLFKFVFYAILCLRRMI